MSDLKSKMPDLNELTSMAGKLFNDVKNSVSEIVDMYKHKREVEKASSNSEEVTSETKTVKKTTTVTKEESKAEESKEKDE